jgi:protein gp37
MSENTKIEWTDHTFNPWIGCTKVSPGGANLLRVGKKHAGRKWNEYPTT